MAGGCWEPGCPGRCSPYLADCGGDWYWIVTCPCGCATEEWPAQPWEVPGGVYEGPENWEDVA